jgi:hypothetical protein
MVFVCAMNQPHDFRQNAAQENHFAALCFYLGEALVVKQAADTAPALFSTFVPSSF